MGDLRAIDGGKAQRAKTVGSAAVAQCPCGSRTFLRTHTGILLDKAGKEVSSGTKGLQCARCGRAKDEG